MSKGCRASHNPAASGRKAIPRRRGVIVSRQWKWPRRRQIRFQGFDVLIVVREVFVFSDFFFINLVNGMVAIRVCFVNILIAEVTHLLQPGAST